MFLVDTSILIDAQSAHPREKAQRFRELVARGGLFCLTGIVYQEVLQGARDREAFRKLERFLGSQRFIQPRDAKACHVAAADIYARCRWAGVTPRSTVDCLIARIAIEHDVVLLQDDGDYERIRQVVPQLQLA